jgi:hypothetical protein
MAMNAVASGHAMLAAVDSWNIARPAQTLRVVSASMSVRRDRHCRLTAAQSTGDRRRRTLRPGSSSSPRRPARLLVSDRLREAAREVPPISA